MLKFAIIGSLTENTRDLLDIIKQKGHQGSVFRLADVIFEMRDGGFLALHDGQDICDFDIVIFRGYNKHFHEAQLLTKMLTEKGRIVVENTLAGGYVRGKMEQARRLSSKGIKHPETFQANSLDGWNNILKKMKFPIIAKPIFGRKGRGIQKIDSLLEAQEFFLNNNEDYLVQQYFPIVSDYRVFVVGGEVIGCFQRFINEGEYKSNIKGTRAEKVDVSEKMRSIAIDSTNVMKYEVAGVDLFEYNGEFYVIEVNVSPQWEKFKLVTGINPAENIIEYALDKKIKNK